MFPFLAGCRDVQIGDARERRGVRSAGTLHTREAGRFRSSLLKRTTKTTCIPLCSSRHYFQSAGYAARGSDRSLGTGTTANDSTATSMMFPRSNTRRPTRLNPLQRADRKPNGMVSIKPRACSERVMCACSSGESAVQRAVLLFEC